MPVIREVWKTHFSREAFPRLPCPHCVPGRMRVVDGSLTVREPKFSSDLHRHENFEHDWVEQRFNAQLQCDEAGCGEISFVSGDTVETETYLDEGEGCSGWGLEEVLRVRCIFPSPPLFKLPEGLPYEVTQQLELAFRLFWLDISSCAARVRTAAEMMLDEQGVSREAMSTKNNKMVRLNLYERIQLFEKQAKGASSGDHLQALRIVGNLGTHDSKVTSDILFDCIDVLEDVLLEVYEKKSIKAKIDRLKKLG